MAPSTCGQERVDIVQSNDTVHQMFHIVGQANLHGVSACKYKIIHWQTAGPVILLTQGCNKQFESGTAILCDGSSHTHALFTHECGTGMKCLEDSADQPPWPYLPYRLLRAWNIIWMPLKKTLLLWPIIDMYYYRMRHPRAEKFRVLISGFGKGMHSSSVITPKPPC